jgi:hypothetical protein
MMLSRLLREPMLRQVHVDGPERIAAHKKILESKPVMRQVCREFYARCACLDESFLRGQGQRIELGAGVSFMKDFFPDVVLTDVVPADHLDAVLDAQDMKGVADSSIRAFYGIHCFHHFTNPRRFFAELSRTLVPGGGCILIEPYFGMLARLVYPRLFASEHFDMAQQAWETPATGPMSNANQALSYVVLFRDRSMVMREFPALRVVYADQLTNYPRYLLSGGLNFRSLVPGFCGPALRGVENLLSPLRGLLALHHVVVLQKAAAGSA